MVCLSWDYQILGNFCDLSMYYMCLVSLQIIGRDTVIPFEMAYLDTYKRVTGLELKHLKSYSIIVIGKKIDQYVAFIHQYK